VVVGRLFGVPNIRPSLVFCQPLALKIFFNSRPSNNFQPVTLCMDLTLTSA
jgi:hypothetical protein